MLSNIDTNVLILLATGLLIRYHIGRRRFNRRSIAGLQMYRSYFVGLITAILETLFNWIGTILIATGMITLILGY